jgi:putative DNA primase/helicase
MPKQDHVTNVLDALKCVCEVPSAHQLPVWLKGAPADAGRLAPKDFVVVANGLLHVPTETLYSASAAFFVLSATDVAFDKAAPRPHQWHKFLDEVLDKEAQDTLQKWFGYNLTPDTSLQKIMALVGAPRSGKGTIGRMIRVLLGEGSVAAITLAGLSREFGLQQLIGKPACIIPDARFGKKSDPAAVAERLLWISGEDAIPVGRKFLGDWVGPLPTRFTVLTNELIYIQDSSGAVVERFVILKMLQSFLGREDPMLFERLMGELPGILNWAVAGYRNLTL